jgi:hypothetical protein
MFFFKIRRRLVRQHLERPLDVAVEDVLGVVANLAPARVIAVLFSPALVASRRLQMPVRAAADPRIGPGRRDRQFADALQRRDVAQQRAIGQTVIEPVARLVTRDAGHRVIHVAQLRALCRDDRIKRCNRCCNRIDFPLFYVIGFLSK